MTFQSVSVVPCTLYLNYTWKYSFFGPSSSVFQWSVTETKPFERVDLCIRMSPETKRIYTHGNAVSGLRKDRRLPAKPPPGLLLPLVGFGGTMFGKSRHGFTRCVTRWFKQASWKTTISNRRTRKGTNVLSNNVTSFDDSNRGYIL